MSRTGSIGIAPQPDGSLEDVSEAASEEAAEDYSENFDETGTNWSEQRSNEAAPGEAEVAESLAESGSVMSYTEEFDATMTSKSEVLDEAQASASASAQDLSISEDVDKMPEALEAQRQERRKEIARRQEADAQRTAVLRKVSDAFDDISEEDMPSGGEVSDASQASNSLYDPDAKRREEELEKRQKEEEERKQKELEAAEAERKQQQIEEANRRLASERKKKMEEEEARRLAVEAKFAEERRKAEEEKRRKDDEEKRKREEIARNLKEEALQKAAEEERLKDQRKAEEEHRRALQELQIEDERKRREEEQRIAEQRRATAATRDVFPLPTSLASEPRLHAADTEETGHVSHVSHVSDVSRTANVAQVTCPTSPSNQGSQPTETHDTRDTPDAILSQSCLQPNMAFNTFNMNEKMADFEKHQEHQDAALAQSDRANSRQILEETLWRSSEGSPKRSDWWSQQDCTDWRGWSWKSWKQDWWQSGRWDWWEKERFPETSQRLSGLWHSNFDEGPLVRLQHLQLQAAGAPAAFSPPSRVTPSHTMADTFGTATTGCQPSQACTSGAEVGTGSAPHLSERRSGTSKRSGAGPLPALPGSKDEAQTQTAPFAKAASEAHVGFEGFEEELQWAVLTVLGDMMQLKYGCSMELTDLRRQLAGQWRVDHLNGREIVTELGSEKVQIQLSVQELSFQELCACLRHFSGTACAVCFAGLAPCAALRLDAAGGVVGRQRSGLQRVAAQDFSCAWAIEPAGPLSLTEEWQQLYATASGTGDPINRTSPQLLLVLHAPWPSVQVLQAANAVLRSESESNRLEMLKRLLSWLEQDPSFDQLRESFKEVPQFSIALLKSLKSNITSKSDICEVTVQILGKVSKGHVENASSLVQLGAADALCQCLARHRSRKDLQRHGLYAVACLVHDGGGAAQALAAEAVPLALRAMATHQKSPSVQVKGCEVLRLLLELSPEVPLDEVAEACVRAKRLFPSERLVHRAADLLLSFAVPRSAACIGALMDAATKDEMVQRSGICSLGHLAKHGGVAWRGASTTAVNRILRALQHHKGSVSLQAAGLWALGRLAERLEAPGRGGMQDAAQRAKQLHPDSALVQRHADELLAFLLRP